MKKMFLLLTTLFLANLNAKNIDNIEVARLAGLASDDLRGIKVDDTECQNAIINFYGIMAKNGEQDIKLTKEYKDCIAKKQNSERIKAEKEQEKAEREALNRAFNETKSETIKHEIVDFVNQLDTNETQI